MLHENVYRLTLSEQLSGVTLIIIMVLTRIFYICGVKPVLRAVKISFMFVKMYYIDYYSIYLECILVLVFF